MLSYQRFLAFLDVTKDDSVTFRIQRYTKRFRRPQAPISHTTNLAFGISSQFFELRAYARVITSFYRHFTACETF